MKQTIKIYAASIGALISATACSLTVRSIVLLYDNGFIGGDKAKATIVKSIKRLNRKIFKQYKAYDYGDYRCGRAKLRELYRRLSNAIKLADTAF